LFSDPNYCCSSAARVCLKKYKSEIPELLNQPKDGTRWGVIIGECAGNSFEIGLLKKKIDSDECKNSDKWR